jgi:hypothetical protein
VPSRKELIAAISAIPVSEMMDRLAEISIPAAPITVTRNLRPDRANADLLWEKFRDAGPLHDLAEAAEAIAPLLDFKAFDQYVKDNPYKDAHLYAQKWYRYAIPSELSSRFPNFVIGSRELVKFIAERDDISLMLDSSETAHADKPGKRIYLPKESFVPIAYRNSALETSPLSPSMISVANGVICHESAHLAKSPNDISEGLSAGMEWLKLNGGTKDDTEIIAFGEDKLVKQRDVFALINIVEDVYIEHWLRDEFTPYMPFIEASHEFYFCADELLQRLMNSVQEAEGVDLSGKPIELKFSSDHIIEILIMAKNWRWLNAPFWGPLFTKYLNVMKEVIGCTNPGKRAALALRIWWMLKKDPETSFKGDDHVQAGMAIFFDADGINISMDPSVVKELEKAGIDIKELESSITRIVSELDREDIMRRIEEKSDEIGQIPPTIVKDAPLSDKQIGIDPRFASLGQRLRMSLTNNDVPGPAMKRGPVMVNTRLSRIITDGKIFSHRQKRKAEGKDYEFVVLVDCSGSMHGGKITEAMTAGFTAYKSLRTARIRTTLLGHTSLYGSHFDYSGKKEVPVVYVIGQNHDAMEIVATRSQSFVYGSGLLSNNYDGLAILKAAEIGFSDKPTKRYMFVISDGQPAGDRYNGESAILHTRDAVRQVRRKGVDIVSITINHGMVKTNNEIYGKEKNVATTSPLVLNELISAMMSRHIH